jgi:hypothetical protein
MQNKKIGLVLVVLVLIGISFYGGDKYAQAKGKNIAVNRTFAARVGGNGGQTFGGRNFGGGFIAGKILAKDATSITIETTNPMSGNAQTGSKIVLYSDKVSISKTVDGTLADLEVGKQVTVTGTTNTDGSISAQSIQLRTAPTELKKQ